jgi:hypothetical protein
MKQGPLAAVAWTATSFLSACVDPPGLPVDVPLDPVAAIPEPPVIAEPSTPTFSSTVVLRGTRQPNTALFLGGQEVVPRAAATAFRLVLPLEAGPNEFVFSAVDSAGSASDTVTVRVVRDDVAPQALTIEPLAVSRTARPRIGFFGTKEKACSVVFNGGVLDAIDDDAEDFVAEVDIALGDNHLRWACRDLAGNESPVTEIELERLLVEDLPFELAPPPSTTTEAELSLSATCDDDVEVEATGIAPAPCVGGAWTATLPLALGENEITVRAAFWGELATAGKSMTLLVTANEGGVE